MNIILLLFIILAVTFASASINMMVSVYGGIDYFLEKAGMTDYIVVVRGDASKKQSDEIIQNAKSITDYKKENMIFYASDSLKKDGKTYVEFENIGLITSISEAKLNYFDRNNEVIKEVPKGHAYVGGILATSSDVKIGDLVTIDLEGTKLDITIDGFMKDALFGSPFMNNPRILLNEEDVKVLEESDTIQESYAGSIYYISTNNSKETQAELSDIQNPLFSQ